MTTEPTIPDATDDPTLPDDQIPEDAVDGVDPTEGDPSARSHELPPEAL